ncbi:MAG: polysaccharide deacetylase, partial [Oscillospiraceae bacterium]|nr:polysaccharide deacetylase [Oscillospiraceae bacterium]
MAGAFLPKEQNRARKRRRRWHYYIPTAIMLLLALACVGTISWAVISVLDSPEPQYTVHTKPTETDPPTVPPTTEPVTAESPEVLELIAQADFVAAGYDYDEAISMIRESGFMDDVPSLAQRVGDYTTAKSKLQRYASPETITHIFFHSLIVDTERAFDGDTEEGGYNMYMTTVAEFKAILQQMYDRGYVLISPYQMAYENENGKFVYGDIMLPPGK